LHHVWDVKGWDDCCPFWDDDGQAYFIATNFKDNYKIHLFKMSSDGKQLDINSDSVIHQTEGSEANKLYKINGMYYHFFSEVKSEGRVAMMERSKNIYGPYQCRQLNHVNPLTDKEPNQGGLIKDSSGKWWFFTHQGTGSWEGRAACLLPVTWISGWPVIGKPGVDTIGNMVWQNKKPISSAGKIIAPANDEFNQSHPSPKWEWNYQPRKDKWSLREHEGFLRLHAFVPVKIIDTADKRKLFYRAGNTLTQRSMRTAHNEVVIRISTAGMSNGGAAGLCHFSETYSTFGIIQQDGKKTLQYDNNGEKEIIRIIDAGIIWLRSTWDWNGKSQYAFSLDGKRFTTLNTPYQLSWGFYRGDRTGIYHYNEAEEKGFIDVDWFHYKYSK
jgi:hypothetical protein